MKHRFVAEEAGSVEGLALAGSRLISVHDRRVRISIFLLRESWFRLIVSVFSCFVAKTLLTCSTYCNLCRSLSYAENLHVEYQRRWRRADLDALVPRAECRKLRSYALLCRPRAPHDRCGWRC